MLNVSEISLTVHKWAMYAKVRTADPDSKKLCGSIGNAALHPADLCEGELSRGPFHIGRKIGAYCFLRDWGFEVVRGD